MVTKALIPVAGKATRLIPLTSVVPKALFPLVNGKDHIRAVLHVILGEARSAGIEHVGVIANPAHIEMLKHYFHAALEAGCDDLPSQIEYIIQPRPQGFGDAVFQGAEFIGNDPFMLLLGDHIYVANSGKLPCAAQIIKAFDSLCGVAMVGMQSVSSGELSKVGVASGVQIDQDIYRCTNFIEKPDLPTARQELLTNGLPKDTFLAHCGIYIFTPEIFNCISEVRTQAINVGREVELAEAQVKLMKKYPEEYFLYKIAGRAYDIGTPTGYSDAQSAFRSKGNTLSMKL